MSFFNVKDVADILSVNEETVRRWVRRGELKADPIGGRVGYRISTDDLEDFLVKQKGWAGVASETKRRLEKIKEQKEEGTEPSIGKISELGFGEVLRSLLNHSEEDSKAMEVELFQKKYDFTQKKVFIMGQIKDLEKQLLEVEEVLSMIENFEKDFLKEK